MKAEGKPVAPPKDLRVAALRRFASAITILNIFGHTYLGFEVSYAYPIIALLTAYSLEVGLEWIDSIVTHRKPGFLGKGFVGFVDFLLPGHITALACSMLIYSNESHWPIAFAVAVGVCSKFIFRAPVGKGTRHFFNPSNTGIAATLVIFPWVGVAPPYQFTEYVYGSWDAIIPLIVICTGSFLNTRFTRKMPLIAGWIGGFILQALIRGSFFGFNIIHAFGVMTGMAFLLFTFYMISDPGTVPSRPRNQFIFGLSVATLYGVLCLTNVVYQMFFALIMVCATRGVILHVVAWNAARQEELARAGSLVAPLGSEVPDAMQAKVRPTME